MIICSFMFLCIDSFIDLFIAGKRMQNLWNKRPVDLVTSEEKLKKLTGQPSSKQFIIFNENLATVERAKVELTFNRQIYARFHHPGSFKNANV